jgi:negative regulator of sigma E activity
MAGVEKSLAIRHFVPEYRENWPAASRFGQGMRQVENLRNFAFTPVFNFKMNNEPLPDSRRQVQGLLSRLPDVPVASNFTARVMQAVELEEMRQSQWRVFGWSWRAWVPRATVAAALAVLAAFTFQQHNLYLHQVAIAKNAALVASQPLPSMDALKNFDAIQRMSQPAPADDELLALASDMK